VLEMASQTHGINGPVPVTGIKPWALAAAKTSPTINTY